MGQALLFPDPRPLDRRLGRKFFLKAPARPGVYLMKDKENRVLYVGKAKSLKQRLDNYRIANPDKMPRRHLRMVREVARIEFQFCKTEEGALKHEKKLIRSLKPRFNRAGVWPGKAKFIVWRVKGDALEISTVETPGPEWQRFGPLGGGATFLQQSIARLIWLAVNPRKTVGDLPTGWAKSKFMGTTAINCCASIEEIKAAFESFFFEGPEKFGGWLAHRLATRTSRFERSVIEQEMEVLTEFASKPITSQKCREQLALL